MIDYSRTGIRDAAQHIITSLESLHKATVHSVRISGDSIVVTMRKIEVISLWDEIIPVSSRMPEKKIVG